jgi:hypothetical protein
MKINFRRGFIRIGIVLLIVWEGCVIGVTLHERLTTDQQKPCRPEDGPYCEAILISDAWSMPLYPAGRKTGPARALNAAVLMVLPPMLVLVILWVSRWVLTGFRRADSNTNSN